MNGVALTSLWVAARRAVESERADALFRDPFARALAGDDGFAVLARANAATRRGMTTVEVRTRFYDERIASAAAPRQVAILAAGMDARAFRLAWPAGTRVFEIDQAEVLAYKHERLGDAIATCERIAVGIDLRDDWPTALVDAGLDPAQPTQWLVEGLLPYLTAPDVTALFARIDALAAPGSRVLFDVLARWILESPVLATVTAFVDELGAPWRFGVDDPTTLLAPLGWDVTAHDFGEIGRGFERWPLPRVPGATPSSFLVEATKR